MTNAGDGNDKKPLYSSGDDFDKDLSPLLDEKEDKDEKAPESQPPLPEEGGKEGAGQSKNYKTTPPDAEEDPENPALKKVGKALDGIADDVAIAAKDIVVEAAKGVVSLVKQWAWFTSDPERYIDIQKQKLRSNVDGAKQGAKNLADAVQEGAKDLVDGTKQSVSGTTRRMAESAKELGYDIREKGVGEVARDALSGAGQNLEQAVSKITEEQLAASEDLYLSGFDIIVGQYVPEQVRTSAARDVRTFVLALQRDYDALPEDLKLSTKKESKRNTQTRQKILEDFTGYATTQVDELLYHLKLRRGEYTKDPDPTLTLNEIKVLEGPVGEAITGKRDSYLRGEGGEKGRGEQ